MKSIVANTFIWAVVVAASSGQYIDPALVGYYGYPVAIASQYHAQDELGRAQFGYSHPGQASNNYRDAFGNQIGSYSYFNPEGKQVQVSYTADHRGFRVLSNDLPVAPVANLVAPLPVQDTPEVAQAKATHMAALSAAQQSVADSEVPSTTDSPVTDVPTTDVSVTEPTVTESPVTPAAALPIAVQDTPEVAVAKQEFFALFQAAKEATAAANAAAPATTATSPESSQADDGVSVSRRKRQVYQGIVSPYYGLTYNYAHPWALNYYGGYSSPYYNQFGYSYTSPVFDVVPKSAEATTNSAPVA